MSEAYQAVFDATARSFVLDEESVGLPQEQSLALITGEEATGGYP